MRPRRRHPARPHSSGGGTPPAGPQTSALPWPSRHDPREGPHPTPPECTWGAGGPAAAGGGWSRSRPCPCTAPHAARRPRTCPASSSRAPAAYRSKRPRWGPMAGRRGRDSAAPWGCSPRRCRAARAHTCGPSRRGGWSTTSSGTRPPRPPRELQLAPSVEMMSSMSAQPRRPPAHAHCPWAGLGPAPVAAAAGRGSRPATVGVPPGAPPPAAAAGR